MSVQQKPIRSVAFEVRSTPYYDGEIECGLFIAHDENAGAEVSHEIDILVDENKNLRGIIICLHKENATIEIGTKEDPVPVEILEQLQSETGVLIVSTNKEDEIVESYQINYTPEEKAD